jgi:hypothetical protein
LRYAGFECCLITVLDTMQSLIQSKCTLVSDSKYALHSECFEHLQRIWESEDNFIVDDENIVVLPILIVKMSTSDWQIWIEFG